MKIFSKNHLIIEALSGSILLCSLLFLLFSKYGFGFEDEGLLWYASQRTHVGELAIRDFFAYDPGRYFWNSFIFYLTGNSGLNSLLIAASAFGGVGLATSWYTMGVAKITFPWRLTFAIIIAIALCYPRHKVYEQTLSLILVSIIYFILLSPGSIKRWFFFGILTGIAAFFGRNHGVFFVISALILVLYLWIDKSLKNSRNLALCYITGIIVGYLPILSLISFDQQFRVEFIDSVLSVLNWQLSLPIPFFWRMNYSSGVNFDIINYLSVGLVCILAPLVYLIGLFILFITAFKRGSKNHTVLLLGAASLAGLPYLHQAFDRADFGHIAQSILPVFIAIAAMICEFSKHPRFRIASYIFCILSLIVCLSAWVTSLPITRMLRAETSLPGSIVSYQIDNNKFLINSSQANILSEVRRITKKCEVTDNEFLALPQFPGIYAYLGLKAPFWEMYYLYQRSSEFQLRHIKAISKVKVILISPDATVDGLEKLKLKYTYGDLMGYIEKKYKKINSTTLPSGVYIYIAPGACGD